jgi:hypothetical protein
MLPTSYKQRVHSCYYVFISHLTHESVKTQTPKSKIISTTTKKIILASHILKNNRTDFEKTMDMVIYNKADAKKIQTMQESKNDLFISTRYCTVKIIQPSTPF